MQCMTMIFQSMPVMNAGEHKAVELSAKTQF